jgi:2-dehydro-3-deoxygalactonokinase
MYGPAAALSIRVANGPPARPLPARFAIWDTAPKEGPAMTAAFIAGDWGLSHLRLWLCDGAGRVLESRNGPGVAAGKGDFAQRLSALLAGWECCPIVLCGMVGSTIGWKEVPYVPAPAAADDIARAVLSVAEAGRRVTIIPGVRGTSEFGAPDVMRGEETQIIGALRLRPELGVGAHQFCLPGSHTKWVDVRDGRIETITTSISGELFALLAGRSTLGEDCGEWDGVPNGAFRRGLSRNQVPLLNALFETRARRLAGELPPADQGAFLSGLIIGADVARARSGPVVVVGAEALNRLYEAALQERDVEASCLDGNDCAIAGLAFCHRG